MTHKERADELLQSGKIRDIRWQSSSVLQQAFKEVAEEEREACLKIAETHGLSCDYCEPSCTILIERKIKERGQS